MAKPDYRKLGIRCAICGCELYEDDHFCLCCGEPIDWWEEDDDESG